MFTRLLIVFAVMVAAFPMTPAAALQLPAPITYLAPDGNDANDCTSPASRCATIARGLARLADNGELRLASGTYAGTITLTRSVSIKGGFTLPNFSPGTLASTLDGQQLGSTLLISGPIAVRLTQLAITGGAAANNGVGSGRGGGVSIDGAAVSLDRVQIHHNTAAIDSAGQGGGIYIQGGSLTVASSQIFSNSAVLMLPLLQPISSARSAVLPQPIQSLAGSGGGIFARNARVALRQSSVSGNSVLSGGTGLMVNTSAAGGAMYAEACQIDTLDTQFLENDAHATASTGGALTLLDSYVRLRGGRLADNRAHSEIGVGRGGGIDIVGGHSSLTNVALRGNQAGDGAGIRLESSANITATAQLTLTNVLLAEHAGTALTLPGLALGRARADLRYTSLISNSVGVLAGTGQAISITNSLLVSNTLATRAIDNGLVALSYTDRYGNTLDAEGTVQLGPAGDLALPPRFKPGDGHYHVLPTSPLIDRGSPIGGVANDFESQPRSFDGNGDGIALPDLGWDEMVRSAVQFGPNQTLFAKPGQTLTTTLDLYNVGLGNDSFAISVVAPPGWTVGVQPAIATLDARSTTSVILTIAVPAGAGQNSQAAIEIRAIGALSQATATVLVVIEDSVGQAYLVRPNWRSS
ncbi:MAG TPA: hypothetical protein VFX76_11190 [Roseiflexaceae bacterium]|nr:hypothetical protein [Roseiflexaceae bacterium]